jgi:hypothetical protein
MRQAKRERRLSFTYPIGKIDSRRAAENAEVLSFASRSLPFPAKPILALQPKKTR